MHTTLDYCFKRLRDRFQFHKCHYDLRLDAYSTMFISKLYKSQAHYAHGATMCTSACIFWVVGCLQRIITPLCSVEDMDVLMKHAADVHSKLVLRGREGMLQQHEIFQATRVPEQIRQTADDQGQNRKYRPTQEASETKHRDQAEPQTVQP